MSFEYLRKMPTVEEILQEIPMSPDLLEIKNKRDAEVTAIFRGESDKFIMIIGPCSADNEDAVCEYVSRLAKLQEDVKDELLLIPRMYTNKPRTTGIGYKGMGHQPIPTEEPNMVDGLKALRRMHIRSLRESHLTAADEMLYPSNYPYVEDLLSYVAIGARSVENQKHRLTVSGLDIPCGMKNPTGGDWNVMLNSIQAAQAPHVFVYNDWEVKTPGNPLAHAVLRGAMNQYGRCYPNYHYEDLMRCAKMYAERNLDNPAVIVDASHANSSKVYSEQPRVAIEVMQNIERSDLLKKMIKGLMVESYLVEGSQKIDEGVFGKSITDPCLGWEDSEKLVKQIAELAGKVR